MTDQRAGRSDFPVDPERERQGSLVVAGTGIRIAGHITFETAAEIRNADRVLYLVTSSLTRQWIIEQNSSSGSLAGCYREGEDRLVAYRRMVETIMSSVRAGLRVCAAFYGHPGVFVWPSHEAIRQARAEGYDARMLPGISAEDCLFADLGIDPAESGCQSYEASDFLVNQRISDPSSLLVLWQIAVVGESRWMPGIEARAPSLDKLKERLGELYSPHHEVILYEAAQYPLREPSIKRVELLTLDQVEIPMVSTLVVPPRTATKSAKPL